MKSVLISIKPKWCELIASGKKTVEVRKTRPKLETPFKCYIYCTKGVPLIKSTQGHGRCFVDGYTTEDNLYGLYELLNGKVIGEFVCDRIVRFENKIYDLAFDETVDRACIEPYELAKYCLPQCYAYGWHISDLVIYDKPRELGEFYAEGDCDCMNCKKCYWFDRGNGYNVEDDCALAYKGIGVHKSFKPIIRPFQSWGYVESEDAK